ncbi:MAG: leucyl/phenylalanyl-tRNA--protein transferase [Xanthomonadales bacterium]|nr:leucyl/phenylalanyl-tRNA--protein transferase [Xanthomonadales bacterium]
MIPWLDPGVAMPFPDVETAAVYPNGLLAAGGDLEPERLLDAYRQGIFPWYSDGEPILWWSPDPRMVLNPAEVYCSRRLARTIRRGGFSLALDRHFESVMRHCAAPRDGQPGTWITEDMLQAYTRLHQAGFAHSLEVLRDGALVGGIYGVGLGRAFFGESMFHSVSNASKIALVALCGVLTHHHVGLLDCQLESAHLFRMGARPMPRSEFISAVGQLVDQPGPSGHWHSLALPLQWAPLFAD